LPEEGTSEIVVIVAARDEADRIAATIDALKEAFPGASPAAPRS
jgi:hypothetical protein